jgi:SOS-response transcriptional repressor LexA
MMGLTKRQSEALAFIRGFIEAKGYSPTIREIAAGTGGTVGSTHALISHLIERGALSHLPGKSRSLAVVGMAA